MSKYDVQAIKDAARGRGADILSQVAGIPAEHCDGRGHECSACGGKDRFRFDQAKEFAICNQCFNHGNGDIIAAVMHYGGCDFPGALARIADYLGLSPVGDSLGPVGTKPAIVDVLTAVAKQKRVTVEALQAYGAVEADGWVIIPAYSGEGEQCTTFRMKPGTGKAAKGLFQKGKPAGLFLPTVDGKARIPQPGETWIAPEGVKDAAALWSMGYLAVGLNTCKLAEKFASMFRGVHVVFVPDRDVAGDDGSQASASRIYRTAASVKIAALPAEMKASGGADVRDVLCREGGEQQVRQAIDNAHVWGIAESCDDHLPEIKTGPDEERVTDETIAAISHRENLYQRGGMLVEVQEAPEPPPCIIRPEGGIRAVPLARPREREIIASSARFTKLKRTKDGDFWERTHVPATVVEQVESRGRWAGIRHLEGIVSSAQFLADGSILSTNGYDPRSGLYLESADLLTANEQPTRNDAVAAAGELLETIVDFPMDEVSRAGWVSLVLTGSARYAIDGPAPLFGIDANTRGAGKSIAADTTGVIHTGRALPRTSATGDDNEMRKRITATLIAGEPLVLFDNVAGTLGGPALDAVLTSTTWTDRILCTSSMTANLPAKAIWIATGNNLAFGADTARRTLRIRLETPEENPEERVGFRHPNLLGWVRANRGRLSRASVTILRAWHLAGRPDMGLPPWGSFDAWSTIIRNAVVWVGLSDPGASRQEVQRESDREAMLLRQLLAAWQESDPEGHGLTVAEAIDRAQKGDPSLSNAFSELANSGGNLSSRSVGMRLHHLRGRVCGGLAFDRKDSRMGALWVVRQANPENFCGTNGTSGTKNQTHAGEVESASFPSKSTILESYPRPLGNSPASPASPANTICDHCNPSAWVKRDGKAFCPGCDKYMGRTREVVSQ